MSFVAHGADRASPRRMTIEEWAALPEDEPGELVDGELVEEEIAGYVHEVVVVWLAHLLRAWALAHGARVAGSAGKFVVSATQGRMPDLTVYLAGARRPPAEGPIRVPPSIAVEVVSATPRDARRDRVEKLKEYAAFGVKWYWIVDPALQSFEILELGPENEYIHKVTSTDGRIESVPGCVGLVIDLDALWAEVAEVRAEGEAQG
ncbi:Uma2 family endonuclease [Polyangium sp. 15x6]|uniref:Uma2 family endonuclease n=1 Tax=Polyangium sp. 15x6 TaxID=3042687 RepID=UPI00249B733B|nr:Uma2 family endonuclease [Polyangium sp. 15x6]MDI3286436.1 Uma2 family endonuclease [Polyangium sp. 15x6]